MTGQSSGQSSGQASGLSVVLAGGGSAGHVSPLLALADALRRRAPTTRLLALGTLEGLEARLVPAHGLPFVAIPKVPLPRRPSGAVLAVPGRLRQAVDAAARHIAEARADVVVGMGGYVSPPAYLAARRLGVPIVVHEQNSRAGIANRLGARLTRHVAVTFPGTRLRGSVVVGMPLRRQVTTVQRTPAARAAARAALGLDADRTTLLVTGGSLGAQRINSSVVEVAADLAAAGVQVLHLTGAGKAVTPTPTTTGTPVPYVVREYLDDISAAYVAADLVLCRAGANTVCELTVVGLPAVYVPLPIGNGEQRHNAEPVVAAGGGLLVDNADLTPAWLRTRLLPLLADRARLDAMAAAARRAGISDADERLADMVVAAASARPAAGSRGRHGR